jgi:hypothetical protein
MTEPVTIFQRIIDRSELVDGPLETPCWIWQGAKNLAGYGRIYTGSCLGWGPISQVHRFTYVMVNGPILPGLEIDHLCRVRACCNPEHLEAVTRKENLHRGLQGVLKTNCPQGHPYNEANTMYKSNGWRVCRECNRIDSLARWHRNAA